MSKHDETASGCTGPSSCYALASELLFTRKALASANKILNENGMFGIIPDSVPSFREGRKHHAEVRAILKKHNVKVEAER